MFDVQFNDVRMAKELQIFNFSFDAAGHVSTDELLPSYYFESHLLSSALVDGKPHFTK